MWNRAKPVLMAVILVAVSLTVYVSIYLKACMPVSKQWDAVSFQIDRSDVGSSGADHDCSTTSGQPPSNQSLDQPSENTSSANQQIPENSSSGVTIRVETDKPEYALREIVFIRLFLVNKGAEAVRLGPVNYGYNVYDSNGEGLIGLRVCGLWLSDFYFNLNPYGEILLTSSLGWGQEFARLEGSAVVEGYVSPGTYTILVDVTGSVQATAEIRVIIAGN